jgi:hypothetical protein
MRWEQIDLKAALVHVARLKNGLPSTHPIRGPELRALRKLRHDYPETPYLFVTERGGPMTPATARKLIARAGELAKFPFPIHPHMLRHSAGYKLAEGHDTRSIQQYLGCEAQRNRYGNLPISVPLLPRPQFLQDYSANIGQIPTKERKVPQGGLVFQHVNARGWHWSEIP